MSGVYWLPEWGDWGGPRRARRCGEGPPPKVATGLATKPVRLALLGSGTMAHLHAAIRVAGLRRGLWITLYENDYGQYWQELSDPGSALHAFRPNAVLFALDPHHLTAGLGAAAGAAEAAAHAARMARPLAASLG